MHHGKNFTCTPSGSPSHFQFLVTALQCRHSVLFLLPKENQPVRSVFSAERPVIAHLKRNACMRCFSPRKFTDCSSMRCAGSRTCVGHIAYLKVCGCTVLQLLHACLLFLLRSYLLLFRPPFYPTFPLFSSVSTSAIYSVVMSFWFLRFGSRSSCTLA